MKLIVGMGNPNKKYEKTRHNVGFRVIDKSSCVWGIELCHRKHFSVFGKGKVDSKLVFLVKPLTYVNLSGRAVKSFMRYYSFDLRDLLVIYDDMDLSLGRIRIRPEGGSGGHKGVESIILSLGSGKFPRVRIGIGRGNMGSDTEFVLGKFSPHEEPVIEDAIDKCVGAVEIIAREGLSTAMSMFN